MVIRELVTKLGFDIDHSKIAAFDRQIGELKNQLGSMSRNLNQIGTQLIGVGGRLTLFLTTPLLLANIAAIKVAATIEQLDLSFEVMLGSAEKGTKLMKDLFEFAAKTPFQIRDIGPTAKRLLAVGIASKDVIETLRVLGNAAAGLGVPLQQLVRAYGDVQAKTKLTGEELRQFTNAGVPLLAELAKAFKKNEEEIFKMISARQIGFEDVKNAFTAMSGEGGRFFNLMDRLSLTMGGLFSNLLDNLFLVAGGFGEVIIEVLQLKKVVVFLNRVFDKLLKEFKALNMFWKVTIILATIFLTILGPTLIMLGLAAKAVAFLASGFALLKVALGLATLSAGAFNVTMLLLPAIILAVVAVFALLVEDIFVWVTGGESLIGDLLGPWKEWRDSMVEFLGDVRGAIIDFLNFDIANLAERAKDIARTLRFIIGGGVFGAEAEQFVAGLTKKGVARQETGVLKKPFRNDVLSTPISQIPIVRLFAQSLRNRSGLINVGGITVKTEVNVAGTSATPEDIADKVSAAIAPMIEDTINKNLIP